MRVHTYYHIGDHALISGQDVIVICVYTFDDTGVEQVYYCDGSLLLVTPLDNKGARAEKLYVRKG